MTSSPGPLEHLVSKAGQLYSLPAAAMEVLELTNNPTVDVAALKQCIENDPALTTKVLRVVNSSLFGLSREVSDLGQALSLLGTKPLKLLVLGFSLPEKLFHGVAAEVLERYWRHTLTKAVAAREIAAMLRVHSGDEAFIAGLLQDLGILLLIQEVGKPYLEFLQKVHDRGSDLATLETGLFGFDHTELTSRLLRHWGLPDVLVEAVRWTDGQPGSPSPSCPTLGEIVHWAGLVAQLVAEGRADALGELLVAGDASLRLSQGQLEQLVEELEAKVEQLAEVLSLRLPEGRDFHDVLVEAHLQLAQVAAEVAGDLVVYREGRRALESESQAFEHEFHVLSDAVARIVPPASPPVAPATADQPAPESIAARPPHPSAAGSSTRSPSTDTCASHAGRSAPADARAGQAATSAATEVDPALLGTLDAAVSECRQSQCGLTLLLVELDDVARMATTFGEEGFRKLRQFLETTCRGIDHADVVCVPHGKHGFAVILPDCERQSAVRLANQLIDRVRQLTPGSSRGRSVLSISIGAATVSVPSRNFPCQDLVDGAHRCLYGSQASGGGVVKSIEIY
ncbi:MAG TPA: HDOD domain-containing protein [Thermoguttaceae bacterium]|nr:HDOD domain-containing protein [Thermoguttaceae bacterium]